MSCDRCGSNDLHACPGYVIEPMSLEEETKLRAALFQVFINEEKLACPLCACTKSLTVRSYVHEAAVPDSVVRIPVTLLKCDCSVCHHDVELKSMLKANNARIRAAIRVYLETSATSGVNNVQQTGTSNPAQYSEQGPPTA